MKKEGGKAPGKEDISSIAQPEPAPELSLAEEAKRLGLRYWIKVSIGFLFVIFFCTWVPNAWLQYKYSEVFAESPCKLCRDLNNMTAPCFNANPYLELPNSAIIGSTQTTMWTLHPMRELGFKARWLSLPCDVCGESQGGELALCLNQTFAAKKTLNNKNKFELNLTIP